jgi:hypothetical protein
MRLGELLIDAKAITAAALEAALHAQVMWGARLGTALVELGAIDLDSLSNALGFQYRVPAALTSHFDRADRALQLLLSPNHAERFECVPLVRVGKRAVVVAAVAPLEARAIAILSDELAVDAERIIFAVAPELRIRYALERVYKIARPQRFLRAPGSPRALPKQLVLEGTQPLELAELEELPAPVEPAPSERRNYVPSLVATPRVAVKAQSVAPRRRVETSGDRAMALTAIRSSSDRERVARLTIEAVADLEPVTEAAVLLIVRSEVAVSWTSFRRDGKILAPIAVPLDQLGLVPAAIRRKTQLRAAHSDLSDVDHALVVALGVVGGEVIVEPLVISGTVTAILVVASHSGAQGKVIGEIGQAAAESFARLMRDATK